jgi:hypothetical protein
MQRSLLRAIFAFVFFIVSTSTFTGNAQAACAYGSMQMRVQQGASPWSQNINITLGQDVHLGLFYNGTLSYATSGAAITATGPWGYGASLSNNGYVKFPYAGMYIIRGTCDTVLDNAVVTVLAPPAVSVCPYGSIQTRVQLNLQTSWTQLLNIYLGESVHVGAMYNGVGLFAPNSVTLTLTGPNGFAATVANDGWPALPYSGLYVLHGACGALVNDASITVLNPPSCPYSSIQARVQPNLQTAWTQSLNVNPGQTFHVGAMYNGVGQFAPSGVMLTISGPNGYIQTVPNDGWVSVPSTGTYTLHVACGTLVDNATINSVSTPVPATCPYSSVQARVQPNLQTAWTRSLTVDVNQSVHLGAMYNGTGYYASPSYVALTLIHPNGSQYGVPIDGYFPMTTPGTYRLRATCGSSGAVWDEATITVNNPQPVCAASVKLDTAAAFSNTLSILAGQRIQVSDGTAFNNTLTLTGPYNYRQTFANNVLVTPPLAGTYNLTATCSGVVSTAMVTVTHPVLTLQPPPPPLSPVVPDFCFPQAYTQEYNGSNLEVADNFDVAPTASVPMRSLIYWPQYRCTGTPMPIVFIMHGQGQSYYGYSYIANQLSARGYVVVSIDGSFLPQNPSSGQAGSTNEWQGYFDDPNYDELLMARARLVLKHMQRWMEWSQQPGYLQGRIDMTQVGLLGHSRGGPAVRGAYALLDPERNNLSYAPIPRTNPIRSYRWPLSQKPVVRGVFEMAPRDVGKYTVDADGVPWGVLVPTCDNDVYQMDGIKPFDRMLRKRAADVPASPKAAIVVHRANHNYYNELSANEYINSGVPNPLIPCISTSNSTVVPEALLDAATQRQTALATVIPFFTAWVGPGANPANAAVLDPINAWVGPAGMERSFVTSTHQSHSVIVDDFADPAVTPDAYTNLRVAGSWIESRSVLLKDFETYASTNYTIPYQLLSEHDPGQRALWLKWNTGASVYDVIGPNYDLTGFRALEFRVARRVDASNPPSTSFWMALVYSDGGISSYALLRDPLTGPYGGGGGGSPTDLHGLLQTVRVPLASFGPPGRAVKGVRFWFPDNYGSIYLSDVRFARY